MPKQINTHRPGQALVRRFGLKGRYQPVLDETIVPVTSVDNETIAVGCLSGGSSIAAVALELGYYRLQNPSGSGKVLTIVHMNSNTASGQIMRIDAWGIDIIPGSKTSDVAQFRDTSKEGLPAGQVFHGTHDGAFGGTYSQLSSSGRNTMFELHHEFLIYPGDAINVYCTAANIVVSAWGILWTERSITEG